MRVLAWILVVLGGLVVLLAAACLVLNLALRPAPRPLLPPPVASRYTVAVLGDAQKGLANLGNLLRAVAPEMPAFFVQSGDFVAENDPGHYRLVKLALERAGVTVPLFVAPGNHDLKGDVSLFKAEFGPLEQSFKVGDVAWVLINNAFGAAPELPHLKARIAAAGPANAVVLVMHQPPFDLEGKPRPEYAGFLQWLEVSGVDYLLTGHVHTYLRKTIGRTTVIVNGVGGDYDSWQLDEKVHATILEIDGAKIRDRSITLPPEHGVVENLEHFALGHAFEAWRRRPLLCGGWTLVLLGAFVWGLREIRRKREPFPPAAG